MKVGTREFKNRLSHYLRCVRDGEVIFVSDRGEVIAEVKRVAPARRKKKSQGQLLSDMAARGEVSPGTGKFQPFKPLKLEPGKSLSKMILEDRR